MVSNAMQCNTMESFKLKSIGVDLERINDMPHAGGDVNQVGGAGDEWAGGNLVYHLKPRPKWYDVSKNTLTLKGGFILANHPKVNCKNSFEPIFKAVKIASETKSGYQCFVMYRND